MALKGDDPPVVVIGELKLTFNLELVLQGVDRAAASRDERRAASQTSSQKPCVAFTPFAVFVEGSALACLECHRTAKSRFCLVRTHRPRAKIPIAGPVSSRSTGAGGAILPKAEDREPRS